MIADLIKCGMIPAPELLVGGTPCQAFSVAGNRESLDDDRGQLTLEYVRLLNAIDEQREEPAVCVWENVPGVLNTKDNAFGCFLGELAGSGCELQPPNGKRWGNAGLINGPRRSIAWRVLDAQFFGVAQRRRRRVFVVASARDGFDPGQILFEFDGVRRDTPPSRETGEEATHRTDARFKGYDELVGTLMARDSKGVGNQFIEEGKLIVLPITDRATRHGGKTGVGSGNGLGIGQADDPAPTLTAGDKHAVCIQGSMIGRAEKNGPQGAGLNVEHCFTLNTTDRHAVAQNASVRKLTPLEGERLQGFPDNHTLLPFGAKQKVDAQMIEYYSRQLGRQLTAAEQQALTGDGPRYKAIGNSKAVPVVRWVGQRILDHLAALRNTSHN
jgi:DNA (cytosine-5)-methyltransferase 1